MPDSATFQSYHGEQNSIENVQELYVLIAWVNVTSRAPLKASTRDKSEQYPCGRAFDGTYQLPLRRVRARGDESNNKVSKSLYDEEAEVRTSSTV